MIPMKHVLVATDFSPVSHVALAYGRELARTFGARLHVLHALQGVTAFVTPEGAAMLPDAATEAAIRDAAQEQLECFAATHQPAGFHTRTILVSGTDAGEAIDSYAKDAGIDLIVIGSSNRSTFDRFVMGSVTEKVIHHAPCPVLTVHQQEPNTVAEARHSLTEYALAGAPYRAACGAQCEGCDACGAVA